MIGAWGKALDPNWSGKILQMRTLDWDMKGPFRNLASVTVYHPVNSTYGHPYAMVGFPGFIGALSGISSTKLGISEIGVAFPDASFGDESRAGVPFIFLLKDILNYDYTVDDAISRMAVAPRTCDLILGVGDGKLNEFRGFEYSYSTLKVFDDQNMMPLADWHPRMDSIVYWGMDWICPSFNLVLSQQLQKQYGMLNPMSGIKYVASVEQSGSNHAAFYDLNNLLLYVSFASPFNVGGPEKAFDRQYTVLDLNLLFSESP